MCHGGSSRFSAPGSRTAASACFLPGAGFRSPDGGPERDCGPAVVVWWAFSGAVLLGSALWCLQTLHPFAPLSAGWGGAVPGSPPPPNARLVSRPSPRPRGSAPHWGSGPRFPTGRDVGHRFRADRSFDPLFGEAPTQGLGLLWNAASVSAVTSRAGAPDVSWTPCPPGPVRDQDFGPARVPPRCPRYRPRLPVWWGPGRLLCCGCCARLGGHVCAFEPNPRSGGGLSVYVFKETEGLSRPLARPVSICPV